ncbi:hypothetical protein H257_10660 [Aphanomyces astaci]|uniref:Reverse transcriptase domain-containing protein n=1 Tax=Aphanomyces astaci TaxID=112090 RepID=W4G726_APHAT|nr:hypothetical protein H257_10660 [Aphanomyces astaci]ETV75061.1 hypothetical protein H257_10660 [Aphanomyces astaci]|eukprot:XP_009835565.1 hypothetical protein H257_10660 [Aphanomyces astaci]
MAQLESQRRTTEHHDQGLRAAAASSVMQAEALEDMRCRTSARWHVFTAAPPPLSVQVPASLGVQMVYGFQAVPKAPTFNGSTKQVYQIPLSGCIDPLSVECIAFWEIGKPSHELTEEDWRDFSLGARIVDPVDMTKLNQAMGKLRMDISILSSESRVSKLVSFEATLVRLNLEGFAESEPKLTVDFLMAAIMPPAVQKRVRELMKIYENRGYKKDARAFKNWLAEYMRRYGEFEPLVQATPLSPRPTPDKTGDKGGRGSLKDGKCFKCLSTGHNVFKCPKVADGEARLLMDRAKAIWAEARGEGKTEKAITIAKEVKTVEPSEESAVLCAARVVCTASQAVALDASFDSGADQSVIPPKTLQMLKDAGRFVGHTVAQEVKLTLKFEADVGSLVLANVKCWLSVGNLPAGVGDILLSRPIIHKLGYDPQSMLREADAVCSEYDMEDVESTSAEEEEALVPMELAACFPDMTPVDPAVEQAKVQAVLDARVAEALVAGCGAEFALGLSKLLAKYMDVFCLTLGRDPPVDMPPLKVHPTKNSKPKHVEELEKAGFIYRNPASRWACAPLIVRESHTKDEFRMTVDLRPVNSQTEQIAWPMPMLEGYWQFSLDLSCQEMFSFLTDTGVYTSYRVMQGGSDSVAYCQATVQAMFAEQLYKCLLTWLDDLLGYHKTPSGLLLTLAEVLEVCAKRGLKLHPKK